MVPVKRIHLIIEALENIDFTVFWTHIGDGPLHEELQEKAKRLSSKNKKITVNFLGQKTNKEVLDFYKMNPVDLFINVSESEGIPVSIMEAASRGIPVIATDVGGTSELVDDNERVGFLLPVVVSPEEIAAKIKYYFELPKNKKEKMRTSILNKWEADFDAEKNYKDFCCFLINIENNYNNK
jgi:glycosyltransferase involved in cell wall biosynthesis